MRRRLLPLALVAAGFAAGFVVARPPAPPPPPVDFRGVIVVRRGHEDARHLTPHAAYHDGRRLFAEPERADGKVITLVHLDGGRLQIAATDAD